MISGLLLRDTLAKDSPVLLSNDSTRIVSSAKVSFVVVMIMNSAGFVKQGLSTRKESLSGKAHSEPRPVQPEKKKGKARADGPAAAGLAAAGLAEDG